MGYSLLFLVIFLKFDIGFALFSGRNPVLTSIDSLYFAYPDLSLLAGSLAD